jgi:hypothetical protein
MTLHRKPLKPYPCKDGWLYMDYAGVERGPFTRDACEAEMKRGRRKEKKYAVEPTFSTEERTRK